jgi:DNA-directed RNA polymerase specialized sigma24 family protein
MILLPLIISADTFRFKPHRRSAGKGVRMPSEEQDLELLAGNACRDEDSLRELFLRHGRRMTDRVYGILGDRHAAEDAVRESLITVWGGASAYRRRGRVIAWLLGIAHHKSLGGLCRRVRMRSGIRIGTRPRRRTAWRYEL